MQKTVDNRLSIVVPMYNEAQIAYQVITQILGEVERIGFPFEIICVDDGSTDGTANLLDEMCMKEPRLVSIHLSRNFGKESAMAAGLASARGDAVILIDGDLQHPPELISCMVELWKKGYKIVAAKKRHRGHEVWIYRVVARIFYRLMSNVMGGNMQGSSDFQLLDREAVEAVMGLTERNRFFRGLTNWIGFRSTCIEFDVMPRSGGNTRWSTAKLIRYATNNILAFTTAPLYYTAWMGVVTILLGLGLGIQTLYNYIVGHAVSGFTTVILTVIFFGGVVLTAIGVVAIYLAKVLEEVKGRPIYIVRGPAGHSPLAEIHAERTLEGGAREHERIWDKRNHDQT